MLIHPQFDPVALSLGPVQIHWYGLMYLLAFAMALALGRARIRRHPELGFNDKDMDDILFYGVIGVIAGGRLGYILFYNLPAYLDNPLAILYVWQGGMSFHGGFLGVVAAMFLYAHRTRRTFWAVTDFVAPLVPLGLAAGRLGNFINGELPGRATEVPWGMVFPQIDQVVRHPSQIYAMLGEGFLLFGVLWWLARRPRPVGQISAAFLMGYGLIRFVLEFAREPDAHLGVLSLGLTMGQWLSWPMVVAGALLWWQAGRRRSK